MQIRNKTILVYGGTSGIGKEVVRLLITKGGLVGFTGTNVEKGNALVKQIREEWSPSEAFPEPPRVLFYPSDITDWTLQKKVYEAIEEEFGQSVDIVIVIAGMVDSSNIIDDTEQDGIYKTIQVNLTAAAKANRIAIQHFFREKKPGCVINTSSIFGFCAAPLAPLYAATKHGIIGLTKSYGNLLRETDIRVNAVSPHFVDTPMISGEPRKVANSLGTVSMDRCTNAYLQLIEDDSANGKTLTVSSQGTHFEPCYSDDTYEVLDHLCEKRRKWALDRLLDYFA